MRKGFTLLEMLVAIAVFTVVITIGLNSLLSISAANKKAQTFRIVQDNLNFVLESLSKSIRTGYDYYCSNDFGPINSTKDCVTGGPFLTFTDSKGNRVMYREENNKIKRTFDGAVFEELTSSDEISVYNLNFYVWGSAPADNLQPMVTVVLSGRAIKQGIETETNLQITISQRVLDL